MNGRKNALLRLKSDFSAASNWDEVISVFSEILENSVSLTIGEEMAGLINFARFFSEQFVAPESSAFDDILGFKAVLVLNYIICLRMFTFCPFSQKCFWLGSW